MFGRKPKHKHEWRYFRAEHFMRERAAISCGESVNFTEANRICEDCKKQEVRMLDGYWTLADLNGT